MIELYSVKEKKTKSEQIDNGKLSYSRYFSLHNKCLVVFLIFISIFLVACGGSNPQTVIDATSDLIVDTAVKAREEAEQNKNLNYNFVGDLDNQSFTCCLSGYIPPVE